MGVYIPNMEMPTACVKCRFCTAFECLASGKYIKDHYNLNDDCPLVEVKAPHGRLIDEDELIKQKEWAFDGVGQTVMVNVVEIINAPTVLEAEGKTATSSLTIRRNF